MYPVGLSTCGLEVNEKNFEALIKADICHIEISLPFDSYPAFDHKRAGQLSRQFGVNLWSYHLPFASRDIFNIASLNEELRTYTVNTLSEYIRKGADIGSEASPKAI